MTSPRFSGAEAGQAFAVGNARWGQVVVAIIGIAHARGVASAQPVAPGGIRDAAKSGFFWGSAVGAIWR